jgi:hypothetical protein
MVAFAAKPKGRRAVMSANAVTFGASGIAFPLEMNSATGV